MQILYLAAGPLGKDLTIMQRLLFLPTHWLTQSLMCLFALLTPLVFLLFGVAPMTNTSVEASCFYLMPTLVARHSSALLSSIG